MLMKIVGKHKFSKLRSYWGWLIFFQTEKLKKNYKQYFTQMCSTEKVHSSD